jgi:hypothetical protein
LMALKPNDIATSVQSPEHDVGRIRRQITRA